jgi:hypothetical protein
MLTGLGQRVRRLRQGVLDGGGGRQSNPQRHVRRKGARVRPHARAQGRIAEPHVEGEPPGKAGEIGHQGGDDRVPIGSGGIDRILEDGTLPCRGGSRGLRCPVPTELGHDVRIV